MRGAYGQHGGPLSSANSSGQESPVCSRAIAAGSTVRGARAHDLDDPRIEFTSIADARRRCRQWRSICTRSQTRVQHYQRIAVESLERESLGGASRTGCDLRPERSDSLSASLLSIPANAPRRRDAHVERIVVHRFPGVPAASHWMYSVMAGYTAVERFDDPPT